MKSVYFVVGGLLVAGNVVGAVQWLRSSSARQQSHQAETTRSMPELADSTDEASSGDSKELQRLRAELRRKDAMLGALAAAPRAAEAPPAQVSATPPAPDLDPAAHTAEMLDERMFTAPQDPAKAGEMERALRDIVIPGALDQAKASMVHCGSTLCKVSISAETDAAANRSMIAMSSRLPKLFGASVVLQLGKGESAMYLAKSSRDLDLEPESAAKP